LTAEPCKRGAWRLWNPNWRRISYSEYVFHGIALDKDFLLPFSDPTFQIKQLTIMGDMDIPYNFEDEGYMLQSGSQAAEIQVQVFLQLPRTFPSSSQSSSSTFPRLVSARTHRSRPSFFFPTLLISGSLASCPHQRLSSLMGKGVCRGGNWMKPEQISGIQVHSHEEEDEE
jgi:hypothetical protein